jgi:hypothetical protein
VPLNTSFLTNFTFIILHNLKSNVLQVKSHHFPYIMTWAGSAWTSSVLWSMSWWGGDAGDEQEPKDNCRQFPGPGKET